MTALKTTAKGASERESPISRHRRGIVMPMSTDDVMKLIAESKLFLEPYKMYGPMITDGISQLDRLETLVRLGENTEAYQLILNMCAQVSAYRGFVPELASKLDRVRDILGKTP
jgi:hypothetical protein